MLTPNTDPTAPPKGVAVLLMNAQTVNGTKSTVVTPSPGINNHTFTLKTSAACTGAVQLETADDPAYTGVWNPLGGGPIDLSTITTPNAACELQLQFNNITFGAARARITTVVGVGTLSVSYLGSHA